MFSPISPALAWKKLKEPIFQQLLIPLNGGYVMLTTVVNEFRSRLNSTNPNI